MSTCAHQLAQPIEWFKLVPSHRKTPEILNDGSIGRPIAPPRPSSTRSCPDENAGLSSHQTQQHLALVNPTTQQELGAFAPNTAIYTLFNTSWSHPRSSCADTQTVSCPATLNPLLFTVASRITSLRPYGITISSFRRSGKVLSSLRLFSLEKQLPLPETSRLFWLMECYRGCPFEGGCY